MAKKKHDENSVRIAISARLDSPDAKERYLANMLRNGCSIDADGLAKLKGKDLAIFALFSTAKKYDSEFPFDKKKAIEITPSNDSDLIEQPAPKKKGASKSPSIYANAASFVLEKKV